MTTALLIVLIAIVAAAVLLGGRRMKRLERNITSFHETQNQCQLSLAHMRLPKVVEDIKQYRDATRVIEQFNSLTQRIEHNFEIYKNVSTQFIEKVEGLETKIEGIATIMQTMSQEFQTHRTQQNKEMKRVFRRLQESDKRIAAIEIEILEIKKTINKP